MIQKNQLLTIVAILLAAFAVFIVIQLLYNSSDVNALPDFLAYFTSNPLITAILAGLILFLTIGRFQSSSEQINRLDERISQLDSKIDDNIGRNSKLIEESIHREVKGIYERADFLYEEVRSIEERHEWLQLFTEGKMFFDVPTAVAVFEDTLRLIQNGNLPFAYVWLYNSVDDDIFGDERSILDLSLIALLFYDDVHLALKILQKIEVRNNQTRSITLLYFTVIALRSNSLIDNKEIYREIERIIFTKIPLSWAELKNHFSLSRSERHARKILRRSSEAYASLSIFFAAAGEYDKQQSLSQKAKRFKIEFSDIPFEEELFAPEISVLLQNQEVITTLSHQVNPSSFDRRLDFIRAIGGDDYHRALNEASEIKEAVLAKPALERRDRVFRTWFATAATAMLEERQALVQDE